jgi:hypothetical protein
LERQALANARNEVAERYAGEVALYARLYLAEVERALATNGRLKDCSGQAQARLSEPA